MISNRISILFMKYTHKCGHFNLTKKVGHLALFTYVHVLLTSIQLQTDTKTIPTLLFTKYRN